MITLEQFTELAHRTASRYSHRSEPARAFYTFSPEALADFHRQVCAAVLGEPTRPKNSQEWAGMDASTAFLLIQRHADGWADIELMLNEWRTANPPAPAQQERKPMTEQERQELYVSLLNESASGPGGMFKIIVEAVERHHGIKE